MKTIVRTAANRATGSVCAANILAAVALIVSSLVVSLGARAQQAPVADPGVSSTLLTEDEIIDLVAPIALYPDDLVSIILPASTYPLQVVQAARFLEALENDASLEPDAEWDNAVVALLNYPEVLRRLDADLDWTWDLGQAVLNQQAQVFDAIQEFREQAYLAGNLETDDRQTVSEDDGVIEIEPADPEVVYVPYYEPEEVIIRHSRPAFGYYDFGYPLYYYPYPVGYAFPTPFFWGVTSAFSIGWHTHYLNVYHPSHYDHPYYGYAFNYPYYWRRGVNVNINLNQVTHVWQPDKKRRGRPNFGADDGRRVRSDEDYSNALRSARQRRIDENESYRSRVGTRSSDSRPARGTSTFASGASRAERAAPSALQDTSRKRNTAINPATADTELSVRDQRRSRSSSINAARANVERQDYRTGSGRTGLTNSATVGDARAQSGAASAADRRTRNVHTFASGRQEPQSARGGAIDARERAATSGRTSYSPSRRATAPTSSRSSIATRANPNRSAATMGSSDRASQSRLAPSRQAPSRAAPTRSAAPRMSTRESSIRTGNGRLPRRQ